MSGVLLWGWDNTNKKWIPLAVDANGYVKVDISNIKLNDLANVSTGAPDDDDLFYYDDATSLWKSRKLVDADIPAAIARDTEVTAVVAAEATARAADVDAEEAARIAADAAHTALTTGIHGITLAYPGESSVQTLDLAAHKSRHQFGGADPPDFTDWLKQDRAVVVHENGSTFDKTNLWTQSLSAGMSFVQAMVGSYFITDATANRTGYLRTVVNAYVYDWFHWIVLTVNGASNFLAWLWISHTLGDSTPVPGQKCAGFKLEDGKIYAYSADGTAAEETEISNLNTANNSYMLKNNTDSVAFYLNGNLKTTHSVRYPGAVTQGIKHYLTNKANVAKSLYIRTVAVRRT